MWFFFLWHVADHLPAHKKRVRESKREREREQRERVRVRVFCPQLVAVLCISVGREGAARSA